MEFIVGLQNKLTIGTAGTMAQYVRCAFKLCFEERVEQVYSLKEGEENIHYSFRFE